MHVSSISLLQPLIDTLRSEQHSSPRESLEAEAFPQHTRSGVRDADICHIDSDDWMLGQLWITCHTKSVMRVGQLIPLHRRAELESEPCVWHLLLRDYPQLSCCALRATPPALLPSRLGILLLAWCSGAGGLALWRERLHLAREAAFKGGERDGVLPSAGSTRMNIYICDLLMAF